MREGFEPSVDCSTHTFQACAFDHSTISPLLNYSTILYRIKQEKTLKIGYLLEILKLEEIICIS
jgi:hypothetical protein